MSTATAFDQRFAFRRLFALLVLTSFAFAATAHAQGDKRQKIDTDGDGKISRAEAANFPKLNKNFDAIDANKDGFISRDELKAVREARKASQPR